MLFSNTCWRHVKYMCINNAYNFCAVYWLLANMYKEIHFKIVLQIDCLAHGGCEWSDFANTQAAAKHTGDPPGNIKAPVVLSTLETEPQTGEPNKSSSSAGLYKSQKGSQKRTDHHAVGC